MRVRANLERVMKLSRRIESFTIHDSRWSLYVEKQGARNHRCRIHFVIKVDYSYNYSFDTLHHYISRKNILAAGY